MFYSVTISYQTERKLIDLYHGLIKSNSREAVERMIVRRLNTMGFAAVEDKIVFLVF
jgi:hypothetical protein